METNLIKKPFKEMKCVCMCFAFFVSDFFSDLIANHNNGHQSKHPCILSTIMSHHTYSIPFLSLLIIAFETSIDQADKFQSLQFISLFTQGHSFETPIFRHDHLSYIESRLCVASRTTCVHGTST